MRVDTLPSTIVVRTTVTVTQVLYGSSDTLYVSDPLSRDLNRDHLDRSGGLGGTSDSGRLWGRARQKKETECHTGTRPGRGRVSESTV